MLVSRQVEARIPAEIRDYVGVGMKRAVEFILAPDGDFGVDAMAGRDAFLLRALAEGVDAEAAMRQAAVVSASVVSRVDTTSGLLRPDGIAAASGRLDGVEARWLA